MSEVITMPKLGLDMVEGTFLNWLKNPGDLISKGDVIAEVESDKATLEVAAEKSGKLIKTLVNAGDTVAVGAPIAELDAVGAGGAPVAHEPAPVQHVAASTNGGSPAPVAVPVAVAHDSDVPGGIKASPIARKIATERGIDLAHVQGSGPGGRIVKSDVESYTPTAAPAQTPTAAPVAQPTAQIAAHPGLATYAPKTAPTGDGITEEPLTKMRSRIASRMVESKQTVPHFYVTTEIDMAPALALRKQINSELPENQKISVNDMVVKAVALALRQFPNLNSHFYGDKVVRFSHINIGMAVSLEGGGLINVVAKDADILAISRLAEHNKEMIARARSGKVKPEDIEGSTFTVSNMGPYDVESFSAIINPPEAGILAVASAREVPVVVNGELKIGTRMKVTLSVDHRISDGAEGAQYVQVFRKLLENPMRLLV
jgi:pyruvate dehydrogenase E2 component (dihydrolipoamide acetyltransferase)